MAGAKIGKKKKQKANEGKAIQIGKLPDELPQLDQLVSFYQSDAYQNERVREKLFKCPLD